MSKHSLFIHIQLLFPNKKKDAVSKPFCTSLIRWRNTGTLMRIDLFLAALRLSNLNVLEKEQQHAKELAELKGLTVD